MDVHKSNNFDETAVDILDLLVRQGYEMDIKLFTEEVMFPLYKGRAHVKRDADGQILWYYTYVCLTEGEADLLKRGKLKLVHHMFDKEVCDVLYILSAGAESGMFVKDYKHLKDTLKMHTRNNKLMGERFTSKTPRERGMRAGTFV